MSDYKVLITTAGVGLRLGEATKYTNKCLMRVGDKPVLSHIIEAYPENVEMVISVGYFADHVKEFVKLAYPKRKIEFVDVSNYEGEGSSMGYSMLLAKDKLQCPFVIHTGDTIIRDNIPEPSCNWHGGAKGEENSVYKTFTVMGDEVKKLHDRGSLEADFLDIGISGISDYGDFWKVLERLYKRNSKNEDLCECDVLSEMIDNGSIVKVKEFFEWFDTGRVVCLNKVRKAIPATIEVLDKDEESIFIFDKFVIKFFSDEDFLKRRVARAKVLKGLVPKIEGYGKNFYRYKYVEGEVLSKLIDEGSFDDFLDWSRRFLWKKDNETSKVKFNEICNDFYLVRTRQRLIKFRQMTAIEDGVDEINGIKTPPIEEMLKMIDRNWLCDGEQMAFHGDFILDNIVKTKKGYCLLDWRQDFGGLLKSGDMYYDLAKLNHNLTINHEIILKELFVLERNNNKISCDILRKEKLVQCQRRFEEFLRDNGFDIKKVRILTAIVWLNMCPLHTYSFNVFLYYFGKLNLWKAINQD